MSSLLSRRDFLKASGAALSGLTLGGAVACTGMGEAEPCAENYCQYPVNPNSTQRYSYPEKLKKFTLEMQPDLAADEMRITFLGSGNPPGRIAQGLMSIFVEVGPWMPDPGGGFGKATDSFVFDIGAGGFITSGVMGITYSRMDKVFISHLHGDHMSDLTMLYCFGPVCDRKWPLYVWGQGPSGVANPSGSPKFYDDGTNAFCSHFREAMRWHTEGQSYLPTSYPAYQVPTQQDWHTPVELKPVGGDAPNDSYAIVPIELDWTKTGLDKDGNPDNSNIAYENNGVRITHFPVVHYRKGAMGYKLEWNGLSLVYTSDTRPDTVSIQQARNGGKGVDLFIHEICIPVEIGVMKSLGLTFPDHSVPGYDAATQNLGAIVESAHTPQGAFGYLLSQIDPHPQLTAAVHFTVADDTVECAMKSIQHHFPAGGYPEFGKDIIFPTDRMVLKLKKGENGQPPKIDQYLAEVSEYTFGPLQNVYAPLAAPKYPSPTAQLDTTNMIQPGPATYCENGY